MTYEIPKSELKTSVDLDRQHQDDPNVVWWSRIDKRYPVEVHRLDTEIADALGIQQEGFDPNYQGVLCVFDQQDDDKLIYFEKVSLAYGAVFGPDAGDVATWQEKVVDFIDKSLPTASRS